MSSLHAHQQDTYTLYRYTKSKDSESNNLQILEGQGQYESYTDAHYALLESNKNKFKDRDVLCIECSTHSWWYKINEYEMIRMGCDKK